MARVDVPAAVSGRIMRYDPELWAPNQITYRTRDGLIIGPFVRAGGFPRWRGQVEIGSLSSGRGGAARLRALSQIDLFIAQMSRPDAWCNMPFGAAGGAGGRYITPAATYHSVVSKAATADAGFEVRNQPAAGDAALAVGDWIAAHSPLTPDGVLTCAIVKAVGDAVTAGGATSQAGLRTEPDLELAVGSNVYPASHIRMRFPANDDATMSLPRGPSFAGPWVFPWEEHVNG